MPAVGDFFRQLMTSVKSTFTSQTVCAVQDCPDKKLQAWRDQNSSVIKQTIADQRRMLLSKKKALEIWDEDARKSFKKAFGSDDLTTRNVMHQRIERMLTANQTMTVNNFKPADPSKPDRFAYVFPNDKTHTVYLDQAFSSAGRTGTDSRGGALSHEMSHFNDIGGTKDKFPDYK